MDEFDTHNAEHMNLLAASIDKMLQTGRKEGRGFVLLVIGDEIGSCRSACCYLSNLSIEDAQQFLKEAAKMRLDG